MNMHEVRLKNLLSVIGDPSVRGTVSTFAKKYDLDPTYIRQIIGKSRTIGERAARNLEESIKLPEGFLDNVEPAGSESSKIISEVDSLNESEAEQVLSYIRFLKSQRDHAWFSL